ncbi:MAG: DUF87 domain-containing protein [Kiritimatiellae bacterium]|nr:DUF87 domain-containing protein [Kiritimatiellia bacterium]
MPWQDTYKNKVGEMNNGNIDRKTRYERAIMELTMAIKSGKITDPLIQEYWQRGLLPGEQGAKAQAMLENILMAPSILADLKSSAEPPEPDIDPKLLVFIGRRRALRRMTGILKKLLTMHLLIQGPTGSGKTNLIWFIIQQLIEFGLKVVFHDHKNEGRKLLRRYSNVVVLRVSDFRENFLKPVGDPKQYFSTFWSEFARAYRIRRETAVKLVGISMRVLAGLKPGDPHPSLYDFPHMLHELAKRYNDPTLTTAAVALESLNATLGEAATVRDGPCADDLFNIVVVQCHGLPAEFLQFFMAIRLFRKHVKAIAQGHTGELTSVIVSDEGGVEFAKEYAAEAGSGYIPPQKRLITQFRSTGTGLIIATQSVNAIDPAVIANVGSFVCLRAQLDADVRISTRLLGKSEEQSDDVRNIPRWSGLLKTPSHSGAVLVDIPEVNMGDYMSDQELDRLNHNALERLNSHTIFAPIHQDAGAPISYRDILGETMPPAPSVSSSDALFDFRAEHTSFIREIITHPDASVVEHYVNLGWSAGRGNRVKSDLIDNGILKSQRQTSRNGRPIEQLVLTEKGRELFDETSKA